jgi:hypothetical protein
MSPNKAPLSLSQDFDSDECSLSRALEVLEVHLGRNQG